jgi:hypothetical protein
VEGIVTALALLACPVGMGLMMLFMFRGVRDTRASRDDASLDDLRAEQRRLAAEIGQRGAERNGSDRTHGVGASS